MSVAVVRLRGSEAALPGRRTPYMYRTGSGLMLRVNRPRALLEKLVAAGELPGVAVPFSIVVVDDRDDPLPISFAPPACTGGGNGRPTWSVGNETHAAPWHVELSRLQLASLLIGSHVGRLDDTAALPSWLHTALQWKGLTVWRMDTS